MTYNLVYDESSGSVLGSAPYGTITLTQSGSNVDVSVQLNSGYNFFHTGAGYAIQYDLTTGTVDTSTFKDALGTGSSSGLTLHTEDEIYCAKT